VNPQTHQSYNYKSDVSEATHHYLPTHQYGTQLDPPAHWAPEYPAIDELPPTYAVRPLVVISIVDQVATNSGYHLQPADIEHWEHANGTIPAGSVVMVRSDWSKRWPDPALTSEAVFLVCHWKRLNFSMSSAIFFFMVMSRLTPTLEGEHWLLHHGYTQAEGVTNLDQVAEEGCLITIGYRNLWRIGRLCSGLSGWHGVYFASLTARTNFAY